MGAKAGVAIGVVTALLGAGGAAVGVMVVRAPQAATTRRAAVVRDDEGERVSTGDAGSATTSRAPATRAPQWFDDYGHLLVTGAGAPTPDAPDGTADRGADTVLLARVKALDGVIAAEVVAPRTISVTTEGSVPALARVPGVASVGNDVPLAVMGDSLEGSEWHLANTGAVDQSGHPARAGADNDVARAWTVSEGAGVIVAVIDTGVDVGHPDLAGRLWDNPADPCGDGVDQDRNGLVDDCRGWDFGGADNDPSPERGLDITDHGTHVAGIVAAGRNGIGVVGVAPGATVMPLKVSAGPTISLGRVATAIRYATDHGASIINLSVATGLSTARSSVTALEAAVAYAASRDVLVVAGAGNAAADVTSAPSLYPAGFAVWYPNVVAVGSTGPTDQRSNFSNFGWPSPAMVYAPGTAIISTYAGGTWGRMSGTSMATPVVAGVAALVRSSGRATGASAVRDLLAATAEPTAAGLRVDAAVAVGLERAAPPTPPTTSSTTATTIAPSTTVARPTTTARTTAPPTTVARVAPTTAAPRPTTAATRPPATTTTVAPLVTTPTPKPAASGTWSAAALSVRSSPLTGGTSVTATGVFPTDVPVEVWFSGVGPSVPATVAADGRSLVFVTPPFSVRAVTDITVRFTRKGRLTRLTLRNAFTFAANG